MTLEIPLQQIVLASLAPSWVRAFMTDDAPGIAGSEDVALNWVITALVIAVLVTGVMIVCKAALKGRAPLNGKYWSLSKRIAWLFAGLFPVFIILLSLYYLSLDFTMIVGIGGLFKGTLFSWIVYCIAMALADCLLPNFRTDWSYRRT